VAKVHKVQQGETLSGIASRYGFGKWEDLWSVNTALREKRKSAHLLYPGDKIEIPETGQGSESAATDALHRFVKLIPALELKLVLNDIAGEPLDNVEYTLVVADKTLEGTTDGQGALTESVPPGEVDALLKLNLKEEEDGDLIEIPLKIGSLDPITTTSGVQARLNNLGYESGPVDGITGALTEAALRLFQERHDLNVTGQIDPSTRDKLEEEHGC
jgi:hypothetical protein